MWLAPNMVTLLGFFCILSNVIFLVIWQPEMDGQVRLYRPQPQGASADAYV
jgi:hypothetical protein